jgi:hypothetical protein
VKGRILFICGSINQTTQMHQISRHLEDYSQAFTPYYSHGFMEFCRKAGLLEFTILGEKLRKRCLAYLAAHSLKVDIGGAEGGYDLVLTCSDLLIPKNIRKSPIVLVQEGILDPPGLALELCKRFPFLPLWMAGTATTGLSGYYRRFCVASEGYRDHFASHGAPLDRIVVTGIPNFDSCEKYRDNRFPHRNFVLVCTSDARETFKGDDRRSFIARAKEIAGGRLLIFKLHPNENVARATREIHREAPDALVYSSGSAEEMIANCDVLLTQYSSTVFVGLALGKEVHSYFDLDTLKRLLPLQGGGAALAISQVCRDVLEEEPAGVEPEPPRPGLIPGDLEWETP